MACSTLNGGIVFDTCARSMGGINKVYLANYSDVDWANFDIDPKNVGEQGSDLDADFRITSIPMLSGASHYGFFSFQVRKNTGSMTSTLNVDDNTGSSVSTDLVMDWREMEYEKRKAMSAFLQGEFVAIVRDANGHYWFLGANLPVSASAGTGETGTANTDANHYTITLNDVSNDWPFEIKVGTGAVVINDLLDPSDPEHE